MLRFRRIFSLQVAWALRPPRLEAARLGDPFGFYGLEVQVQVGLISPGAVAAIARIGSSYYFSAIMTIP
jgi:hypothetical protein